MTNEFRFRRSVLITGILLAIEFSIATVGSVYVSAWNIDGSFSYPLPTAIFLGLFWGAMFIGSLGMIAGYYRERVVVCSDFVFQQRIFRSSTLHFNEITQIEWRRLPRNGKGGRVTVRSSDQNMKIDLGNFTDEDQKVLVSILQSASETIQEEWIRPAETEIYESWVIAAACSAVFAIIGSFCIYYWSIGIGLHWFLIGVCNIAASIWYLWRIHTFVYKQVSKSRLGINHCVKYMEVARQQGKGD